MPEIIYHHGIKGQKWGIRRFQNEDGTLTSAGKKRYDDDSTQKIKEASTEKKSDHRKKLEKKYRNQGLSKEDAEKAAEKRIKAEKVVAIAGAIAVTAAVAYVAKNKYCQEYTDSILKAGTKFQTITNNPLQNVDDRLYAAYKKTDKVIYKGLYGKQLASRGNKVFNMTTEAVKDLKIPSRKKAAEVFADLCEKDPSFRKAVESNIDGFRRAMIFGGSPKQKKILDIASNSLNDKKVLLNEGYNAFNVGLANRSPEMSKELNKFYGKLKELGYNAVADLNDQRYSGFKSKNPVIVFDIESVAKKSIQEMSEKEVNKNFIAQDLIRNGKTYLAELGVLGSLVGLNIKASKTVNKKSVVSKSKMNQMKSLRSQGHSVAEIAKILNVSSSTVSKYING